MNKQTIITAIIIFFCYSNSFSQSVLSGRVYDKELNTPLSYVDIYISETSLGTITNGDGAFTLNIPENNQNDTLIISSLGYEKLKFVINKFLDKENNLFKLIQKAEKLEEVLITSRPDYSPIELVQKALEKHSSVFLKKQYLAKGFIRHSEKTKDEYQLLIEAAFEMYDSGKKNDVNINVLQTRKSIDNRVLDTVFFITPYLRYKNSFGYNKSHDIAENFRNNMGKEEVKKAIAFYDNHHTAGYNIKLGLLENILSSDINKVRNYNDKKASLTKKSLKNFTFKKDTIVYLNDDKVTKISFTLPNKRTGRILLGSFYIRNLDLAIVESNFHSLYSKSHSYYRATGNQIRYSTKVKYKEFNDVMYPFYISHKSFKINSTNLSRDKVSLKGTFTQEEILFSEIIENYDLVNRFTSNTKIMNNNNIFIDTKYNNDFWENYTILLESKEENQMIKDLEKKVSLKQQFKQE